MRRSHIESLASPLRAVGLALVVSTAGCAAAPPLAPAPRIEVGAPAASAPSQPVALLELVRRFEAGDSRGRGCGLGARGDLLAFCGDGGFVLWDLARDGAVAGVGANDTIMFEAAFSDDDARVAVASLVGVDVWELASRERRTQSDEAGTTGAFVAYDGGVVALHNISLGLVWLYRAQGGAAYARIEAGGRYDADRFQHPPAFAMAGGRIALPLRGAVQIFDTTASPLSEVPTEGVAPAVALAPGGKRLAVAGAAAIDLYDDGGARITRLAEPDATALAFSPDGARLFAGTQTGTLAMWDLARGERLARIAAHPQRIGRLRAGGRRVLTMTDDASAVWRF